MSRLRLSHCVAILAAYVIASPASATGRVGWDIDDYIEQDEGNRADRGSSVGPSL